MTKSPDMHVSWDALPETARNLLRSLLQEILGRECPPSTSLEAALIRAHEQLKLDADEMRVSNARLQFLATHDPLTKCLNRRSFFELLEEHYSLVEADAGSLSCVMLDVDRFKAMNDANGHAHGDHVLEVVAATLRANSVPPNCVCRYGGDEFCCLLPGLSRKEALDAAERIRHDIEASEVPGLTVSLGVGTFGEAGRGMVEAADKALYAAKQAGRNCVR